MDNSPHPPVAAAPLLADAPARLTAGVVTAGPMAPAWQAQLIRETAGRVRELRLLISPAPAAARPAAARIFSALVRLMGRLTGLGDPCRPVVLGSLAGEYAVFTAVALNGDRPVFDAAATQGLDILIVLPDCAPPYVEPAELAELAESTGPALGYLAFETDPAWAALESAARFREVAPAGLLHIGPAGEKRLARSLAAAVDPLSPARTLQNVLAKAKLFPARFLAQYNALGTLPAPAPACPGPPLAGGFGLCVLALWLAKTAVRAAGFVLQGALTREQWFLAFGRDAGGLPSSLRGATPVYPTADWGSGGMADPFFLAHGGETFLFFEQIETASGKGVIAAARMTPEGCPSDVKIVLEQEFHLSYPFVFRHGGEIFMMPESAQAGRLDLYRAAAFPRRWEFFRTLLDGLYLVDGTLFEYNGRFWLFGAVRVEGGASHDELYLFSGPSPFGPFAAHPKNPVVSDVRRARPAGRIFMDNGRIIRPAQDCSLHYGRAVEFREIVVLTDTDYAETHAGRMTPAGIGGNLKTHAFERLGALWAADGLRRVPLTGGG
ncbi:MAG: hypothetical protein HQK81_14165 [Desulfovibrionaceae bacterium]|nr:hypothetical protein [Desulfovibrionaceae bacterium]MBF0515188.1 hypothetical protein [Desulfovibrionaceae bacterium]